MRKRASNTPGGARRPPAARRRAGRSGAWVGALALMILLLAAGCDRLDASTPAIPSPGSPTATSPPPPATVDTQTPSPSPTATATDEATAPTPPPEERDQEREAELERLRATNFFVEFAEADRARHATWARFAYDRFAAYGDQMLLFEWANKDELWDSIAPLVRDECLLAGRPATRPMWDAQIVIPASLNPSWNNESTNGRGYFVDFVCVHQKEDGGSAELWIGALIAESEQEGTLAHISPPFLIPEDRYADIQSARAGVRPMLWDWVTQQPAIEGE